MAGLGEEPAGAADWAPLPVAAAAALFAGAAFPWWIAGGHAMDRAAGRCLRPHGDIDVLVLRRDRQALRRHLFRWDCHAAMAPGRLIPWPAGEELPATAHDVWCRRDPQGPWELQAMLDESDGPAWRSRRCAAVTLPLDALTVRDGAGVPFLTPEVPLFYKAKAPRPRDELDFAAVAPLLLPAARAWLRHAIATCYGAGHPWHRRLAA